MERINSWINCILAVIILTGLVEAIVPDGETRKFVLLVMGVISSIVIATPIIKLVSGDFSVASVFDVDIPEDSFYYIDTLRSTVDRQSEILEEIFADNVVTKFNELYQDMEISECKISFLHDMDGKIIEIKEVRVKCSYSVDDISLLKKRVSDICEVSVEKVRVS